MKKRIGIVFTTPPHGSASGREGLDALLALSALSQNIAVFFLGDGVYQILPDQQPTEILARNYPATFAALPFYEVEEYYICAGSLQQRGLSSQPNWLIEAQQLSASALRQQLEQCTVLLTF